MNSHRSLTPEELLAEAEPFTAAAQQAVANELRIHKLLGNPIVVWRDGRVVIVPPEEIVVVPLPNGTPPSSSSSLNQP